MTLVNQCNTKWFYHTFVQLFYIDFILVIRYNDYGHGSDRNRSAIEHIYYCAFVGLSFKYKPSSFFQ